MDGGFGREDGAPSRDSRALLRRLRVSAIAVAVLALAFSAFFQIPKVVPWISAVNATANDPFDAIGSFAVQAVLLLAATSLLRIWWPRQAELTGGRVSAIVRMQLAAVAAVEVTLLGDLVALLRHVELWAHSPVGIGYVVALAALDIANALVGWGVLAGGRGRIREPDFAQLMRALLSLVALVGLLTLYPEALRATVVGALATVIAAAVMLFVPMAELSLALVPHAQDRSAERLRLPSWLESPTVQWSLLVGAGLVAGGCLLLAEALAEGGAAPRFLVVSVYLGLEAAAAAIGFAMMRGPLGIGRR